MLKTDHANSVRAGDRIAANRVLIIDDDPVIRQTMTMLAESSGFEAMATDDAVVFKEHLASWHPTLIILDLQMPGRDGIQILSDLGEGKCDAQVIVATGAHPRILDAAVRVGRERGLKIAGSLQKPFQLETIRALLDRVKLLPKLSAAELEKAIETDQLFLEYQPKFDCQKRHVSGVEALVRWRHPVRGRIAPDQFIALAAETDLIDPLTNWVFTTAVNQAAVWRAAGVMLDVAINVSARNLDSANFPDRLAQKCEEVSLGPDSVILEVTESCAMNDPLHTLEVLTRLRVKGFRLSMDDFGTAYSSLVQLQRMPFSELKIDKSFVTNMTHDKSCAAIARIVIDLAHNLDLKCIAEGVENEAAWDALRMMGCDAAQGYHLSRPISAESVTLLIRKQTATPR